ncbi:MAG: NnrS family protein [Sterolibacterium sp.]|jgi:uncharacterized protein involved in response to NO
MSNWKVLAAPLWVSAFRPFYLLGAAYGPLLMLAWLGAYAGIWQVPVDDWLFLAWHGHEMLFGFAAAIISGIVMTALPSWAGTEEVTGKRLAILVGLWLAGRLALIGPVPPMLAAVVDCALFPAIAGVLLPQLLRVRNRYYLLLLPVLAALFAANVTFHAGRLAADVVWTGFGLRLAIHAIVLLYVLKGGVLTPIFTGNALRERQRGTDIPFIMWLDVLATLSVVALAIADLAKLPAAWTGAAALAACAIHALRLARWRGWLVIDIPLLWVMHLGYAWLVVAFGLKAVAELGGTLPEVIWVHAFTVGSLGMMMLGLMTRVVLRHTGRPLQPPAAIVLAYLMVPVAALLRVAVMMFGLGNGYLFASASLWMAPFAIYLALFGAMLLSPSLPRK